MIFRLSLVIVLLTWSQVSVSGNDKARLDMLENEMKNMTEVLSLLALEINSLRDWSAQIASTQFLILDRLNLTDGEIPDNVSLSDCEFEYNGICYYGIGYRKELNFEEANTELCVNNGNGRAADILNQEHFKMTVKHVRKEWLSQEGALFDYIWTGMEYNPRNKEVTTYDGKKVDFLKWFVIPDKTSNKRSGIKLAVNIDPKIPYGYVGVPRDSNVVGSILCQRPVDSP